ASPDGEVLVVEEDGDAFFVHRLQRRTLPVRSASWVIPPAGSTGCASNAGASSTTSTPPTTNARTAAPSWTSAVSPAGEPELAAVAPRPLGVGGLEGVVPVPVVDGAHTTPEPLGGRLDLSGTEGDDFTGGRVPSHVVAVDHCRRVGADPSPQPDRIDVVFDDVVGGVARLQLDRHRSSRGIAGGQVEEGDHRSPDRFGALAFDEGDADGEFGLADGEAFLVDQTPVVLPHQPELGHLRWGDAGQERVDGGSEVVGAFGGADQG